MEFRINSLWPASFYPDLSILIVRDPKLTAITIRIISTEHAFFNDAI
jgi:hypothetical protein